MKTITGYRRSLFAISLIATAILLLTRCVSNQDENKGSTTVAAPAKPFVPAVTRQDFAGSAACASCHRDMYNKHLLTAHYLSTRPAEAKYIKGSFAPGKNKYAYDSNMVVMLEKRDSGFYQVGYYNGVEKIARRFDVVVGSASKGQTYLFRINNRFYQLPVSYFTAAKQWANSPQFPVHPVIFNRSITSRCLECHSTFIQKTSAPGAEPEEFDPQTMIYGIDCEKCHGPAAKHVAYQTQNPTVKTARFIINPAQFTRQQSLDMCALCHGGRLQKTKPSFSFVAGDTLANFFALNTAPPNPRDIDVHGNQYGLLRSSKCFIVSGTMTCASCHNVHENERGKIALFSQRCMACHNKQQNTFCKVTPAAGVNLASNCIDCHMPLQPSGTIRELLPGQSKPTAAMIRSHLIQVYIAQQNKTAQPLKPH